MKGRLEVRVSIGVLLILGIGGSGFLDIRLGFPITVTLVLLGLILVAERELFAMARKKGARPLAGLVAALTVLLMGARCLLGATGRAEDGGGLALLCALLLMFSALIQRMLTARTSLAPEASDVLRDVGVSLFGFVYLAIGVGAVQQIWLLAGRDLTKGIILALAVVLISKASDIGGYLTGVFLGKRKLAPLISPGKTVEGAAGGLFLSASASFLIFDSIALIEGILTPFASIGFGVLMSVVTQVGDLFESLLKRSAGVKDAADLIPTFGGILDLVDSLTFAAPCAYVILRAAMGGS